MDLNQLLKQRAEKKLNDEIREYLETIASHKFFRSINEVRIKVGEEETTLHSFFFPNDRSAAAIAINKQCLEGYVQAESENFLGEVEKFRKQLDDLQFFQGEQ